MYLVYIIHVFIVLQYLEAHMCPQPEDIVPCVCFEISSDLHVHCSSITSLNQLQKTVKHLGRNSFSSFTIHRSSFNYLPSDIYKNITIQSLSISQSNFSRIANLGEPQFVGLENSLQSILFKETYSEKEPLSYVSLQLLKKLHTLEFRKSFVGIVHNMWFRYGPLSLKTVRFVQCNIQNVGYKAFQTLKNLAVLDLSDNQINYVTRTMFPEHALQLEELNLERNKLESFEEDVFSGMNSLKRVNLELNEFSTLDERVWGQVWSHLQFVNIDYNPIICDRNIKWIYAARQKLKKSLVATCYKPFNLMDRELNSLELEELK